MAISRKDNYFLGFLKQTIMLLIKSDVSRLTGIKIVIKGRFNRAPRAKTNIICFGKFSLQSFNSKNRLLPVNCLHRLTGLLG